MKDALEKLGIDLRLLGMIGALLLIWIVFSLLTDGRYITPRNLYNLSVQTSSVAVMACGMVFVIVTRHIDLSVGSLLGFLGMVMGALQAHYLPDILGHGHPAIWIITIVVGLLLGVIVGAFQGWIVGYLAVPAFIVTLGGFLVWRGAAWWVTSGQTVSPLDQTFKLLGGGAAGTLGAPMSWAVGLISCAVIAYAAFANRRRKVAHDFKVKPLWAEIGLGALAFALVLGFVAVMNSYLLPKRAAERVAEARGIPIPEEGIVLAHGIAIPVLIVLVVGLILTIVANRTKFGRAIFATGGNPEAAQLSGIDTKLLTVKIFALMGGLCALSAVIATARLQSAANDLGTLDELRVIAAAVIGGTALAGGVGTIYGAILGALIMQSLQSGMAMVGVDAPLQSIVVGVVLVLAVLLDIVYRERVGD